MLTHSLELVWNGENWHLLFPLASSKSGVVTVFCTGSQPDTYSTIVVTSASNHPMLIGA